MTASLFDRVQEAVIAVRAKTSLEPQAAIILGTGLGGLAKEIKEEASIEYSAIPGFVKSTVESHAGRLILGTLEGKKVVAMQGRFHRYEGWSMAEITFPVRVLRALGARVLCVANAAGGINRHFEPGDLMVIEDHINLMGDNPLIGANDERLGPRFPDMCGCYDREIWEQALAIARKDGLRCSSGVYASMTGPCLETAAEYRMLASIGADAIGMSTVPEVIVAVHAGMKVLGISVITDRCVADTLKPANVPEIIRIAMEAEPRLTTLMKKTVAGMKI